MAAGPVPQWFMRGEIVGVCNCDWGCPCNFDAPPTYGPCDGFYARLVHEGRYGDVPLDGVRFVTGGHSPGPVHEGGAIDVLILDEASSPEQRAALERLYAGGGVGEPFDIFASVRAELLPTIVAPIEFVPRGIRSEVRVAGGELLDVVVSRIPNPVTGEEEEVYVDKPTGFTSNRMEMGSTVTFRFSSERMSFDYPRRYAEYGRFDNAGPPG